MAQWLRVHLPMQGTRVCAPGSSQTRARTRVPYISRQILNHCATREAENYIIFKALILFLFFFFFFLVRWPLTVVTSPIAEHRLQTRRLSGHGSRAQPLRGTWILPDRGTNPRPLHRQADSQPLRHQGSPGSFFKLIFIEV